jgi:glucose/arabinose dehydrogenase
MVKKFVVAITVTAIFAILASSYVYFLQTLPLVGENRESNEIVQNLNIPWEIVFLPNGDILTTERPGNLKKIGENLREYRIEGVEHIGEGGLLGMALHPDFLENRNVYLYYTYRKNRNELANKVERFEFRQDELIGKTTIIEDIPGARNHNGGRIAFGPDGKLYISTGDAEDSRSAQNRSSLAGKILRIEADGSIPQDNPFNNQVWAYGLRNCQGFVWDDSGKMWAVDHGRSGIRSGYDELNLIEKGKNYGWPVIQGSETREGMETPIAQSGAMTTWAPSGMVFKNGSLFFGGLRGEAIYEAKIIGERKVELRNHFESDFGRIRALKIGPKDAIYIATSNTDGRGNARPNDDRIVKINID